MVAKRCPCFSRHRSHRGRLHRRRRSIVALAILGFGDICQSDLLFLYGHSLRGMQRLASVGSRSGSLCRRHMSERYFRLFFASVRLQTILCRPILLLKKAQAKRKETGDERYYAPIEKIKLSVSKRLENILGRPFKVLFAEPMLMAITIYMSVRNCTSPFSAPLSGD